MHQGRQSFGICSLGSKIYVNGGPFTYSCEVYDVLSGKWSYIAPMKDPYLAGVTTVSNQKRYILSFGGESDNQKYPADNIEVVRRYDCLKDKKGWQIIRLKSQDSHRNGLWYGVIPMGLASNSDT